jgi:hypothetical protein
MCEWTEFGSSAERTRAMLENGHAGELPLPAFRN